RPIGPWAVASLERDGRADRSAPWPRERRPQRGRRSGEPIRATSSPFPDLLAELAELAARLPAASGAVHHVRDAAYLTWRSGNPLARYVYLTSGTGPSSGYLVAHRALQ